MSITYRKPISVFEETDPEEIRAVFLRGGWKALERNYGVSNRRILEAMVRGGGPALQRERAAIQTCGRPAGGAVVIREPREA